MQDGRVTGGVPFCQGPLAALLKNPLYIGKVAHGGVHYEGEHEAIIDDALWTEVQSIMASNRHRRKVGLGARHPSLLTSMLTDPDGAPMTPTFTTKGSQRHHYYVTRLKPGDDRREAWRVPAREVDRSVIAALRNWLRSSSVTDVSEDSRAVRDQLAKRRHLADARPLESALDPPEESESSTDFGFRLLGPQAKVALRSSRNKLMNGR
jgi:site-specific DNA recombinase